MFHAYSAIFTLHISRNMSRIRAYFSRFRHIEDPCITGQSIACFSSQVLFLNHCSDPFGTFFLFCFFFKSKHSTFFFFQDSILIAIVIACDSRQHTNHTSTPSTQRHYPTHPRQFAIHASAPATPPTLAQRAHHFSSSFKCFPFQKAVIIEIFTCILTKMYYKFLLHSKCVTYEDVIMNINVYNVYNVYKVYNVYNFNAKLCT